MPKLVLLALADMAGSSSDQAWPSIEYLVQRTGSSRSTVLRSLETLVNLKVIEVIKRPNRTNTYKLLGCQRDTPMVSQ